MFPSHHQIAAEAYELWERKGGGITSEAEAVINWLDAEHRLRYPHHHERPRRLELDRSAEDATAEDVRRA